MIKKLYAKEIKKGKIRYLYKKNEGVCKARNYAFKYCKNEWIAYLDSDNCMSSTAFERFAEAIIRHPDKKCFYSNLVCMRSKKTVGHKFNHDKLVRENFIDLGAFVHHFSVYQDLGGFDTNMTRLVDWDLITTYTKKYHPYYLNETTLYYNDSLDYQRITNNVSLYNNLNYYKKKHGSSFPIVTTMITAYNHKDYIRQTIESAISQRGDFIHEILISDDGSSDGTRAIIKEYAKNYPHLIRDISPEKGLGISGNMKHCFQEATGKYIAVLEGDDYWISEYKLNKQMHFLEKNKDCSMVFNKLQILREWSNTFSFLPRHMKLKSKLTGKDVIKEPTLNLFANLSCCMFRTDLMKHLPAVMFKTRLNEIALSFYLIQKGKIGFISTPLSVYRMREDSVWTGANRINKLKQAIDCRQMALAVCEEKYQKLLKNIIQTDFERPLKELQEGKK